MSAWAATSPEAVNESMINRIPREILYHQHQLSHQQIDDLLGEKQSADYPESKAQHLGKLALFNEVSDLLTSADIGFIPLKGPVLSYRISGDPLYRAYNDIDFLVDRTLVPKVVELLLNKGYTSPYYEFPESNCRRKLLFNHFNEIYLYNPLLSAGVEVHWTLFPTRITGEVKISQIINGHMIRQDLGTRSFRVFSNELEILYLVIHGGLHGWGKLKWLADIYFFSSKYGIDKQKFIQLTVRLRAERLVSACNDLLNEYFPGSVLLPSVRENGSTTITSMARKMIGNTGEKTLRSFISQYLLSWYAFPGIRYKIDLIKHLFFASDLAANLRIPCVPLLFYIISPFWKLFRGFR